MLVLVLDLGTEFEEMAFIAVFLADRHQVLSEPRKNGGDGVRSFGIRIELCRLGIDSRAGCPLPASFRGSRPRHTGILEVPHHMGDGRHALTKMFDFFRLQFALLADPLHGGEHAELEIVNTGEQVPA